MHDLLDSAPCGFLSFSSESQIGFVNASMRDLLGYEKEELLGRRLDSLFTPGGRVFYQTHLAPMLQMQGRLDEISVSLRAKSGEDIPVILNVLRREHAVDVVYSAIFVPMRQRRRFENELIAARRAAEEASEGQRAANAALEEARAALEVQHAELLKLNAVIEARGERERNIAERLQDALRPSLHEKVPGLDLDSYYRPALEEASVGGDFFDVFSLPGGCYALVVGDLAGKGLAAAAQTATVRHMLRSLLHVGETAAAALTDLNDILASHALITGFATLFAGVYDPRLCALTYVSCGQEPGLLLRAATGQVETLRPTGPVLGAFAGSQFRQQRVVLEKGDVLALFTDGVTEAGIDRRNMLGVDGMMSLLMENGSEPSTAASVTARLISGVEVFATDAGIRDDVCLLVARVEGCPAPETSPVESSHSRQVPEDALRNEGAHGGMTELRSHGRLRGRRRQSSVGIPGRLVSP